MKNQTKPLMLFPLTSGTYNNSDRLHCWREFILFLKNSDESLSMGWFIKRVFRHDRLIVIRMALQARQRLYIESTHWLLFLENVNTQIPANITHIFIKPGTFLQVRVAQEIRVCRHIASAFYKKASIAISNEKLVIMGYHCKVNLPCHLVNISVKL